MTPIDPIVCVQLGVQPIARALLGCDARAIAFVRIEDERTARAGYGECAPLAGLHEESFEEAMTAIEEFLDGSRELEALPPSAAFAVSCAFATAAGLGANAIAPTAVAGFIAPSLAQDSTLLDEALEAHRGTSAVLKFKIGRADLALERRTLDHALAALPHARFRLDGNRSMTRADCESLVRGIDPSRIEYLEDPLRDPSELVALHRETGIPIALDETVLDARDGASALRAELARAGAVSAWVLRLSKIGSLDDLHALAGVAARHDADVVLSTAYESSYTLRLAAHVAATIPNARRAHGLGTASLFIDDVCASAVIQDGCLAGDPLPVPLAEAWT